MPIKKEKKPKPKKAQKYTFDFSISGLISLFVFSVVIMVWMFILGVLVGRGYRPEAFIPQLAKILPQTDTTASAPKPQIARQDQTKNSEILKPEDLNFYDSLKRGTSQGQPVAKKTPAKVVTPSKPASQPVAAPQKPAPLPEVTGKFRYVYQVAAFKQKDRAGLFRDQVRQLGLSSYFLKGEAADDPWFRVYVTFDGTAEQTDTLKAELEKIGVKKALLRSKKPL